MTLSSIISDIEEKGFEISKCTVENGEVCTLSFGKSVAAHDAVDRRAPIAACEIKAVSRRTVEKPDLFARIREWCNLGEADKYVKVGDQILIDTLKVPAVNDCMGEDFDEIALRNVIVTVVHAEPRRVVFNFEDILFRHEFGNTVHFCHKNRSFLRNMIHCFMLSETDYQQKIEHNKKPVIDKDFIDLSETELRQFISDARTKYFYYKKDGVNVACGKELDNKNGKFDTELFACRKLAEYGHEVFLLPENYAKDAEKNVKVHGDTITDNRTLELKCTPANVQGNYRKAKHQATDVFIHIQNDLSKENALRQIKNAIRSMEQNNKANINYSGKVYLYFEAKNDFTLFEFDEKGNCTETNPAKK